MGEVPEKRVADAGSKTVVSIVLESDHEIGSKEHKTRRSKHVRLGFSNLLSNMYALLLILFGIMFPLSEALQDDWHNTHYNGAFLIYIYVVATCFLLYLQFYLMPASHRKHVEKEKRKNLKRAEAQQFENISQPITNNLVLTNPKKLDMQSLTNIDKYITPLTKRASTADLQDTASFDLGRQDFESFNRSTASFALDDQLQSERSDMDHAHVWVGLDSLKDLFAHEGSSFYLRLGALMFGLGNLIYIGLEIDYLFSSGVCNDATYGFTFVLRMIFVIVQTFFIFKNAEVHVTIQQSITRFGFKHLIGTNICIWVRTLTIEIYEHAHHVAAGEHGADAHMDYIQAHAGGMGSLADTMNYTVDSTTESMDALCEEQKELLRNASPYLFPFVLEYSLIAAGIFAIMSSEIGLEEGVDVMSNLKHMLHSQPKTQSEDSDNDSAYSDARSLQNYAGPMHTHGGKIELHSAHRGMFFGFLCLAGVLIATVIFFNDISHSNYENAQLNYLATDITLELLLLVTSCMALYSTNKLSLNSKPLGVDDILLFIAMAGSFLFELSVLLSNSVYLVKEEEKDDHTYLIVLSLISSLLACVQIVLQTILVISGLRRYSSTKQHVQTKPGREALTFLVVTNVTLWIFGTAQIKNLQLGIQEDFYGTLAWLFIMNLNLPLYLFFRFHSSVCLAEVWNVAYIPVTPELTFTKTSEPLPILADTQSRQNYGHLNRSFTSSTESVKL